MNENTLKGKFNGICNRGACDNGEANYFNHTTKGYYCRPCALRINASCEGQDYHPLCFKRSDEPEISDRWKYRNDFDIVPSHVKVSHKEILDYLSKDDVATDTGLETVTSMNTFFKIAWEKISSKQREVTLAEGRFLHYITPKGLQECELSFDFFTQALYLYSNGSVWSAEIEAPKDGWAKTLVKKNRSTSNPTKGSELFSDRFEKEFTIYLSMVQYERLMSLDKRRPGVLSIANVKYEAANV